MLEISNLLSLKSTWRPSESHLTVAAVACLAALLGVLGTYDFRLGVIAAALPLLLIGLTRPVACAIVGVATTFYIVDASGGKLGIQVSFGDALLLLAVGSALATSVLKHREPDVRLPPPLYLLIGVYLSVLSVVVILHPGSTSVVDAVHRAQVVVVAVVVGGFVLSGRTLRQALVGYLLVTTVFAVTYAAASTGEGGLGIQKNPAGQFIAVAVLLVLGTDLLGPRRYALLAPLSLGLFATGSRGALLGLGVGIAAQQLCGGGQSSRLRTVATLVPLALALGVGYAVLPQDSKERVGTFSTRGGMTQSDKEAASTIILRQDYRTDALRSIEAHPFTGVGVGQYVGGTVAKGTQTNNPHNVVLLEAAEGGYPLALASVALLVGSCVLVVRRRHQSPLAAVALAVQVSTITHGLVDVYWVRGTPTMGWLLVGATLADAARRTKQASR